MPRTTPMAAYLRAANWTLRHDGRKVRLWTGADVHREAEAYYKAKALAAGAMGTYWQADPYRDFEIAVALVAPDPDYAHLPLRDVEQGVLIARAVRMLAVTRAEWVRLAYAAAHANDLHRTYAALRRAWHAGVGGGPDGDPPPRAWHALLRRQRREHAS